MYTTCVIWLAFAAVYFAIDIKVFSLCVATNASAYVVLIFLFFPKLYLIIFKPEKNHRSAFATNKDIRCHFGSSNTSKSDISSYRYSEGSSLFRRSVLHRIRFGNTLRLKAEFANSAASSLRTNDLLGSDRRPSSSLSAYPDQWMYHHQHRRLSGSPQAPLPEFSSDDLPYRTRILSQKTLDNIPAALGIDLPNASTATLNPPIEVEANEKHSPDCIYSNNNPKQTRKSTRKKHLSNTNNDFESESSSAWTNDGTAANGPTANSKTNCTCQLLWQLERDTDSIDKFKLFFKRDHLNVDWDYVQGSSEV